MNFKLALPSYLVPFGKATPLNKAIFAVLTYVGVLLLWQLVSGGFIPSPKDALWGTKVLLNKGFFEYWFESIITLTESLAIAFVFSLVIAHLGTIALFRPMSKLIASFRVVSMAPLMTWCAFLGIIGHTRTTGLMVFLITCYSVPSFLQIFNAIGEDELDYYKTLRCGPAMTWWQTTVRARMPIVIATYIINMGMAIHMIPYMEALDKASGGLGVLLSAGERDLNFPEIMAGTILLWMSGLLIFKVMVIATSAIWPKAWSKLTGGK